MNDNITILDDLEDDLVEIEFARNRIWSKLNLVQIEFVTAEHSTLVVPHRVCCVIATNEFGEN